MAKKKKLKYKPFEEKIIPKTAQIKSNISNLSPVSESGSSCANECIIDNDNTITSDSQDNSNRDISDNISQRLELESTVVGCEERSKSENKSDFTRGKQKSHYQVQGSVVNYDTATADAMNTNKSCYDQDKTRQDFNQKKELYYKHPNSSSCHSDRSQNYQRKQVYSSKSNVQYHRQDGNRGQGNYNQGSEALTPDVINGSDHFRDRGATQAIRNKSKLKSSGKYENRECGNATRSTSKWRDSPLPHDSQTIPHRTSHTSDSKTIRHQQGWKSSILPPDSGQSWDNDCQAIPHRKSSSTSLGHVETTDDQERYTYINYMSPVENTAPHESSESWDEVSEKIAIGKYNDDDCDEYSEAVADNKSSIKEAEGSKLNLKAKEFVPTIDKQQQSRPINEKKGLEENNVQSEWSDNYSENVNEGYMNPIPQKYNRRVQSLGLQSETNRQCHTFDSKDAHSKRFSAGDAPITKEGLSSSRKQWDDSRIRNKELFGRYTENLDAEYKEFQLEKRKKSEPQFIKVNEIEHDLFAMPKEYSLAHCVAEDMRMGSGIAVNFKRDFKDLDVLLNQRQKQGGLAILDREDRYIYYLVTKPKSIGKPTYGTLWSSLKKMRDHIKQHNVEKLAIPRLGCGLDRLEWCEVKLMLEFLFKEIPLEITVCNFQQNDDSSEKPMSYTCKVVHVKKSIADIEEYTSIMYFSTEDGHVTTEMEELDKKFKFLEGFKRADKKVGDIIKNKLPKYFLNGCIIRKTKNDLVDFKSLVKCVQQINKECKKEACYYVGIQAIEDNNDDLLNDKIITILRNYFHNVDIYICWDGDLASKMPFSRE